MQLSSAQTASEVSSSVWSTQALINRCHFFPQICRKWYGSLKLCNTFNHSYSHRPGLCPTTHLSHVIPGVRVPFKGGEGFFRSTACRRGLWGCHCTKVSENIFRGGNGGSREGNSVVHTVLWLKRNSVFLKAEHEGSEKRGGKRTFMI